MHPTRQIAKILSFFTAAAMFASLLGTTGLASDSTEMGPPPGGTASVGYSVDDKATQITISDYNGLLDALVGDAAVIVINGEIAVEQPVAVNRPVTISGGTISAKGAVDRMFNIVISSDEEVTFADTTLHGGDKSGGIHIEHGTLVLDSVSFFNCYTTGVGAAVEISYGASAYISGCRFFYNNAGREGGSIFFNGGFLTITDTVFAASVACGNGGGIWVSNADNVSIDRDSVFFYHCNSGANGNEIYPNRSFVLFDNDCCCSEYSTGPCSGCGCPICCAEPEPEPEPDTKPEPPPTPEEPDEEKPGGQDGDGDKDDNTDDDDGENTDEGNPGDGDDGENTGDGDGDDNTGGDNGDNNGGGNSGGSDSGGTNTPDDLDNNGTEPPTTSPGGGNSGGGGSGGRTVSVGRDVYINDQDIPLANELLTIFSEEVPLAEIKLFDIPDTGIASHGNILFFGITSLLLGGIAYRKEN